MFTLLGFAFDWFVISSLVIELFGCGIGCALLRSSGQYEDSSNNDSVGIGTLVAFTICTVIALCVLGFGGYISIGQAAHWVYSNPYVVGIGAGAYLVVGMIASGIWLAGWMRRRVARFKDARMDWLVKNGEATRDCRDGRPRTAQRSVAGLPEEGVHHCRPGQPPALFRLPSLPGPADRVVVALPGQLDHLRLPDGRLEQDGPAHG